MAAGIRNADPDALEEFYDYTSRKAFGLAYRVPGDSAAAEDAVQEAYVTLWRQRSKIDPARGSLTSLLMTVVHRRAIDALRSNRSRRTDVMSPALEYVAGGDADVAERVMSSIDGEEVRNALGTLPDEQRAPVEMAYFQGLTHVEIAAKLSLPLGTVKSRLRLALTKLRTALGAQAT